MAYFTSFILNLSKLH